MAGFDTTAKGLLLLSLCGIAAACGGGSSFQGYGNTGGTAGGAGSGGYAGTGYAGNGSGNYAGVGTAGIGYAGTGYGGDVAYGGDIGYAGSYGTAGYGTGAYAGTGTAGTGYGGNNGGYGGDTAGTGAVAGNGGSAGDNCSSLIAQASAALTAARTCNLAADALQCTGVVTDLCGCSFSVNSKSSTATQAYLSTQKQITALGCTFGCTDIACPVVVSGVCQSSTASSTGAICVGLSGAAL